MKNSTWIKVVGLGLVSVAAIAATSKNKPDEESSATRASSRPTTVPAYEPSTRPGMEAITADNSRVDLDVPYLPGNEPKQVLDVYAPQRVANAPVLVFVHGGEWAKGDKSEVSFKPKFFNENGVVLVSLNYRLSCTDMYPAQANDVAAGVKWVVDNIAQYGGDKRKIVLMGHSAGCHIVSMVGLDPAPLQRVGLKPSDLAAVVAWSGGAYDLEQKVIEGGMYAPYIRKNFGDSVEAQRQASPMYHLMEKPQTSFMYVTADGDKPGSQQLTRTMVDRIHKLGGDATFLLLENRNHKEALTKIGEPGDPTGPMLLKYIQRVTTRD